MTIAALIAMLGAAMGLVVAGLAFGFSTAPGWRDKRWFAVVGLGTSLYGALNTLATLESTPERYITATSPWLIFAAMVYAAGLAFYTSRRLRRPLSIYDKVLVGLCVFMGVASVVPGVAFTDEVFHSNVRWLGLRYAIARTTVFGDLALLLLVVCSVSFFVQFLRAFRKGEAGILSHVVGSGVMLAVVLLDSITSLGLIEMPYFADAGFVALVGLVGADLTSGFVASARALEQLKNELEERVEQRTGQLAAVNDQLMRAEKLAALGQLSAGVAHEINNPAAAVSANLRYLERSLEKGGGAPDDARATIEESLDSMRRITRIVRQLLDAGRSAAAAAKPVKLVFNVRSAVEASMRIALAANPRKVEFQLQIAKELYAIGEQQVLEQVFTNIIVNALHAIPLEKIDGRILIRAKETPDRVVVSVKDNGVGMTEETQRRVFEPFFTTKSIDEGTGLGLPVSLGLLRAVDGTLSFDSAVGLGTTANIELQRADDVVGVEQRPVFADTQTIVRRRLLLIDDDQNVRSAVSRLLSDRFEVVLADSPQAALSMVVQGYFDVVLCDVMMSGDGGPGFYRELNKRDPILAKRVIFFTAGVTNSDHRDFIESANVPVLNKPLDVSELIRFADSVRPPQA